MTNTVKHTALGAAVLCAATLALPAKALDDARLRLPTRSAGSA